MFRFRFSGAPGGSWCEDSAQRSPRAIAAALEPTGNGATGHSARRRPVNRPTTQALRALVAAGLVSVGLIVSLCGASTASAATVRRPGNVVRPSPGLFKLPPVPTFPGVYPLQASPLTVTVHWYDRSTDEQKFVLYRRDQGGAWQEIYQAPTKNMGEQDGDYSYVDTDLSLSGQCYMIAAVNTSGAGYAPEQCTVRPDANRFPQTVPQTERRWYGLSDVNDGTGGLYTNVRLSDNSLTHASQQFGVDLDWSNNGSLWKIQAQGGPQLMYGQAVALRVWGGGWLKYGNETWGADLVLSNTPSYQWYVLGATPGSSIDSDDFALWNSAANGYLVEAHQTWGVSLRWDSTAKPTATVHDASVTMTGQPPVEGYIPFLGYFGGGPGNSSVLTRVSNPQNGPTLRFLKPGHQSSECGDSDAVTTLAPGATMTPTQMQTLYGSATPSLAQSIPFIACAVTNGRSVSVNIQYRDQ
jgi:hypothetical protein